MVCEVANNYIYILEINVKVQPDVLMSASRPDSLHPIASIALYLYNTKDATSLLEL
jgi:hypothetical protein